MSIKMPNVSAIKKVASNEEDDDVFEGTPINDEYVENSNIAKIQSQYTQKYRIIKTILLIFAWVSYGLNFELTGTTLEDLKVLLGVNYQSIAFILVVRSIGYIFMTFCIGLVMDKLLKYSEFLLALAKLLIILPNFLIPSIKEYWVTFTLFLIQGFAQGIYDVGGNQMILRLWSGISNSPISAMQSGYGIGAMITVQLLKPFIKFNPSNTKSQDISLTQNESHILNTTHHTHVNHTSILKPNDITLQVPYGISAGFGGIIFVCFLIAQYFETRNTKRFNSLRQNSQMYSLNNKNKTNNSNENSNEYGKEINIQCDEDDIKFHFAQKLLFNGKFHRTSTLCYKIVQIILIIILCMSVSGFQTIFSAFLFTYLTTGPAKFLIDNMLTIQTLFWAFFVIGRLLAAFAAFNLNSIVFFGILVLSNTCLVIAYVIPQFNTIQLFYWFIICALGLCMSPLIPTCFMLAKTILININSFLVSLFCIGFGVGAVLSMYLTGILLDSFKPDETWLGYSDASSVYIIPLYLFSWLGLCIFIFLLIVFIHMRFKYVTDESMSSTAA